MFRTIRFFLGDYFGVDKKKSRDHFGVGIISGAVQIAVFVTSSEGGNVRGRPHKCRVKKGDSERHVFDKRIHAIAPCIRTFIHSMSILAAVITQARVFSCAL